MDAEEPVAATPTDGHVIFGLPSMNAEEPVAATPTDGHAPGIVDELSSAQQLSAGGAGSNTSSGGRGRPRGCRSRSRSNRGKSGGCPRGRAVSTPVSVVQGLCVAIRGTSGASNTTNTSSSNQRRLSWSNHQTTPGQTSGSARAPRILANPRIVSLSTGLRQNAQYQVESHNAQINARHNMNSSGAEAEERIDSRADDATMARIEEHANAHRAPLSPVGPPLPPNSESDTPSLDVCVPCPPQTDRDRSRICFCDRAASRGNHRRRPCSMPRQRRTVQH